MTLMSQFLARHLSPNLHLDSCQLGIARCSLPNVGPGLAELVCRSATHCVIVRNRKVDQVCLLLLVCVR